MKMFRNFGIALAAVLLLLGCEIRPLRAGEFDRTRTFTSGEAIGAAGLLVTLSAGKVVKCGAGGDAIGISAGTATAGDLNITVKILHPSYTMTAGNTIAVGDSVYAGAAGTVKTTVAGQRIGIALTAAPIGTEELEVLLLPTGKGGLYADTISEISGAHGVIIDGVTCKDNAVTASGGVTANVTGNASGTAATFTGSLTGDVTSTAMATTVALVNGSSAANVHAAELLANAATNANTVSTIVKRDASGDFAARNVTATSFIGAVTGNVTGNASGSSGTCTGLAATATALAAGSAVLSGQITGNANPQNYAHGLGVTPSVVIVIPDALTAGLAGGVTVAYGTHTSTNAVVTVTNGEKYRVLCIK